MKNLKLPTLLFFAASAVFFIHGVAFEVAAFAVFDLNAVKTLTWLHFIYSGLFNIGWMLLMFLALALLLKFFTKQIEQDDLAQVKAIGTSIGFRGSLTLARGMFLFCLAYLVVTILIPIPVIGLAYSWIFLFTLSAFCLTISVCPRQSIFAILFAFIASTMMCLSVGGIGMSRFLISVQSKDGPVRNDPIVLIERQGDIYVATAKDVKPPALFEKFFGKVW